MWQPEHNGDAVVVSSSEGTGGSEVIALLDPPRHAMPADDYAAAERNVEKLVKGVPAGEPFLVGLQDEFWSELARHRGGAGGLPERYIEEGGLGAVGAIVRGRMEEQVVRLGRADQVAEYRAAEVSATSAMASVGSFLATLASTYEGAKRARYSQELADFCERAAAAWTTPSAEGIVTVMARGAEAAGVDLTRPGYRLVPLYMRMRELESLLEEGVVEESVNRLVAAIRAAGSPSSVDRRAAWELYRFRLLARASGDEAEARAAEIDALLAGDELPDAPPEALEAVKEVVDTASLVDMVQIEPGIDKHDLLGAGEQIAVKLELAAILGIDSSAYPPLHEALEYRALVREMEELSRGHIAAALSRACAKLEPVVRSRLARTDDERALSALEPTMRFVAALGRYQVVHDESLRSVVTGFDALAIGATLEAAGADLTPGWREQAGRVNAAFGPIATFFDLTISRAKDLAGGLTMEMDNRRVRRGLLVCDGYLWSYLARWFEGHDVSFCLCAPRW